MVTKHNWCYNSFLILYTDCMVNHTIHGNAFNQNQYLGQKKKFVMLPSATDRKNVKTRVAVWFFWLFFLFFLFFYFFLFLFFLNALNIKKNSPFLKENVKILTNDLFTVCFLLIVALYFGLQKKYIL